MANEELTSDPWDDFGEPTQAPDPDAVEAPPTAPVDAPDVPSMPPPPPSLPTEGFSDLPANSVDGGPSSLEPPVGDGDDTSGTALTEAAPAMPEMEIPDIDMPQIETPQIETPQIDGPHIDTPQIDASNLGVPQSHQPGALEIPDLDLAGVGIGAPDVEIPDVDTSIPDIADVDTSDFDFSDLNDVDLPDMGIADGDVPDIELPEASPTTRTPFSPMLAATGLFGENAPTEESRIEIPETPGDDLDDLVAALHDDAPVEVDPVDLPAEPIDFDDVPEAEDDIDFGLGANPPPSVYSELEDLSDLTEPDSVPGDDVDMAGSNLNTVNDALEDLDVGDLSVAQPDSELPDSELPDSEHFEDWSNEAETETPEAVHEGELEATGLDAIEEPATDEASDTEPPADESITLGVDDDMDDDMDDDEPSYGAVVGSEVSEDLEGTDLEPEDAALAALAAMAAEVDPIVIGDEEAAAVVDESLPVDTDDWLNENEDLGAEEAGFDIGIKLGTGEIEAEAPIEADAEKEDGVDMGTAAAAIGGAAAFGFGANALGDLDPSDLPDMDLPDMDVPEVDVPDMDLPDMDLPEVDLPDMESPEMGTPEFDANEAEGFATIDDGVTPEVDMFDDLETDKLGDVSADSMVTGQPEAWGARWKESAQGWVEDESGGSTWRPIVTTSPLLSEWDVDTYLGVVIGDASLEADSASAAGVAEARTAASAFMVEEALARGAHAVVGVSFTVQAIGGEVLVTASGTAVTLKADTPN